MSSTSKLVISFNALLRKFGFQVVRCETIESLHYALRPQSEIELEQTISPNTDLVRELDVLRERINRLEASQPEQSIQNIVRYMMTTHWRTVDLIESGFNLQTPSACPLCNQPNNGDFEVLSSQSIFQGGQLIRHRCTECDVIFGPQKMLALDETTLDLEYRNLYRIYSEGNTTDSTIRTFKLLNPAKTGLYLDFGCGGEWSEAIIKLRDEGWNIYGFEPSATNSSEFVFSSWEEVKQHQFDGIISHNVLEHIIDPVTTNSNLANLLKDDGAIIHATPCFEYLYEFSHLHVFFFTGKSTEILARHSGMTISDWVRDGEYIACTMRKSH